jgi:hypothetical protein
MRFTPKSFAPGYQLHAPRAERFGVIAMGSCHPGDPVQRSAAGGVSFSTTDLSLEMIGRLERGLTAPSFETVAALAAALQVAGARGA